MAVCNLASIALNRFVTDDKTYNFEKLKEVTKVVTRNLNKIIDVNFYPVPEVRGQGMDVEVVRIAWLVCMFRARMSCC